MKNQWIPEITGHVRIKVKGKYPEMFVNRCVHEQIQLWNIQRVSNDELLCSVMLDEVYRLRKIAKTSECKFSFIEKRGIPFFWRNIWKRKGFVFGIVLFFVCLFLLSNMVWGIKIEGASPVVEQKLNKVIDEIGIKKGALQFQLPSPENIQQIVTDQISEATWIGVKKKGTTYHFQVVEKELVEPKTKEKHGHIVANKKAIIYDYFVEAGKPLIKKNQLVNKGDILVLGLIGKEGEEKNIAAKGKVFGEMWYEARVELPLQQTLFAATGESYRKHYFILGNFSIPIWGFKEPEYAQWKEEIHTNEWEIFNIKLPFHYAYTDIVETTKLEVEKAVEEAISLAKKKGEEKLLSHFTKEAKIIGEKVLHHAVEDGKVKVIIHYRIVDDIGKKQPINQGD